MIVSIGGKVNTECTLKFGTHNGIFHCDEVIGVAILEMAYMDEDVYVIRTEEPSELNDLDIVIDIGGGQFDHHMQGYNKCRSTGEKYASAGLVWEEFAEKAIKQVANEIGISIDEKKVKEFKEQIDKEIIIPIDLEDNGIKSTNHTFSFISKLLPTWLEPQDFDATFSRAESIAFDILKGIIKNKIIQVETKPYLKKRYDCISDGILEIPAQTMQWLENIVSYNQKNDYSIKFVIFPYPRGGWAAQSVPPSIERSFEQLVSFPKEWAGGTTKTLPKISGIPDAIICHNDRFFVRAKTKQSIIEMCKIAMRKAEES